ncbi:hypothetical protein [Ramlibacter sp.]|uniref:hypothetical protein n=1 Tax=Ramlibacter sp. TaxID=1917967 RepID=UPI00261C513E|nr:hypothetical protein [Ramlibacter sp.]MDB5956833.1 uncharacterized protein [Ramlibacter sp.]
MQSQELKQSIARIEQCADDAKRAAQSGNVPQDLRQQVESFHQQASQAKKDGGSDENALRQTVLQLESAADRMKAACQQAGGNVSQDLQQAVQRAHDEASRLKKQIQAGSPA